MIHFQDFKRQWQELERETLEAVKKVGASGWYVMGSHHDQFQKELATFCDFKYCEGVGNGMDAIEIGLRALGVKAGDKVLTTPLSAFATTLAIHRAGGIPVFCDVDVNGLIDLSIADKAIREHQIRFFVPVHLYGQLIDISSLNQLREKHQLRVVEDAAQAIGAHALTTTKTESDIVTLSFYPTKNLGALGDGGAILTDDPELAKQSAALKNYGQSAKYVHDSLGMNSRLDELQAAILSVHLRYLPTFDQSRRSLAETYKNGLKNPQIRMLSSAIRQSVWHLFPVFLSSPLVRNQLVEHLSSAGIQANIHYPSLIPDQKAMNEIPFLVYGTLLQAKKIAETTASLPLHPYLTTKEVEQVIEGCNRFNSKDE